jgi:Spy/CpxP family protein refolding chaperone
MPKLLKVWNNFEGSGANLFQSCALGRWLRNSALRQFPRIWPSCCADWSSEVTSVTAAVSFGHVLSPDLGILKLGIASWKESSHEIGTSRLRVPFTPGGEHKMADSLLSFYDARQQLENEMTDRQKRLMSIPTSQSEGLVGRIELLESEIEDRNLAIQKRKLKAAATLAELRLMFPKRFAFASRSTARWCRPRIR